ncbi:unnamed protein product [Candida verbasci]|uniref:Zn(2)-C6 fungal-type domain-containing protein n=1 Tax=Candida verbasci TaxID=1227364 RepID=A0A9W4TYK1_9ASCO|nr:unnamed protein product [Candida verbasci]
MIMSLQSKNRLKLIIPNNQPNGKILKTCSRCRLHKTKCDAIKTDPLPCSHCLKKNLNCTLDIIKKPITRSKSLDIIEKLNIEVRELNQILDSYISRKNAITATKLIVPTPSISEIQSCITTIEEIPSISTHGEFTISSNVQIKPVSLMESQVASLFRIYEENFNQYLPIFSSEFFKSDLKQLYDENKLLFWSIITTSLLTTNSSDMYQVSSSHLKSLVVESIWMSTPRSVYVISSLLILTTWPLPNYNSIEDNLTIKFVSIMKSLSLQFGLHKLEFITEFSHKTKINVDNVIRERFYKLVNINSNYWIMYLGISNNNYNGFMNDYIINKATNKDIYNQELEKEDKFINSMLKISMIQSKLNENMNNLISVKISPGANTSKLINFNMFEIIIDDLNKLLVDNNNYLNNLIQVSIQYSKLQLFIYAMSKSEITKQEYEVYIRKVIACCFEIISLVSGNYTALSIYYKFPIELTALILLRIYKSEILEIEEHEQVKTQFKKVYDLISSNEPFQFLNEKLFKIIDKFDKLDNEFIVSKQVDIDTDEPSFFLINKMKNYLVGSLVYEMTYLIHESEKDNIETNGTNESIF